MNTYTQLDLLREEFDSLINDDPDFNYEDNDADFLEWLVDNELIVVKNK